MAAGVQGGGGGRRQGGGRAAAAAAQGGGGVLQRPLSGKWAVKTCSLDFRILFIFPVSPYLLDLPHLGAGPPVGEDEGGEGGGEDDHEAAHEHVGGGCLHPGGRAQGPGSRGLAQPLAGGCTGGQEVRTGVSRAILLILTHIGPVQVLKLAPLAHETIRTPASENMSQMIPFMAFYIQS